MPTLSPPAPVQIKDNIIPIEISEYAGYAGLIAANGGLEPTENSVFFKNHGFKVKLTISEDENWSELNEGKIAASVTTADVLAVYGRQLHAVVPAQIGFSRGADGLVVRTDIKRINALKGKTIATAQFTEVDFFIRYLAQEAGLAVNTLGEPRRDAASRARQPRLHRGRLRAPAICSSTDLKSGKNRLAGCVTWEPKVSEVVERQRRQGARPHDQPQPADRRRRADRPPRLRRAAAEDRRRASSQGLLEGNRMVRDRPDGVPRRRRPRVQVDARRDARRSWRSVHLSNLPENLAFFSGAIDEAGSFGGIYQSAVLAYGSDLIKDPLDADRFVDLKHLQALEKTGLFKDQKIAIAPIRIGRRGTRRNQSAAEQGHPVPVRAELVDARHVEPGEPQEPRGDQEAAAGQPGLDAAAARPRRQRAGGASSASRAAKPTCARRRCARWS